MIRVGGCQMTLLIGAIDQSQYGHLLLESVEGGAVRGRYSIIGLDPDLVWRTNGARAEINRTARTTPTAFIPCSDPPLAALRELVADSRIELPDGLPPMAAGIFAAYRDRI